MGDGRLRALAVAAVLVTAGACSAGGSGGGSGGGSDNSVPATITTTTVEVAGEVTIRGPVAAVFASASVLRFEPPVDGYSAAALTSRTVYVVHGEAASLQDVPEGATVEVTGTPGAPGTATLIARLVVVVG